MAKLSDSTLKKMEELLPPVGTSVGNPADIGVATLVAPHLYGETLIFLDQDDNVDMLLAICDTGQKSMQGIVEASKVIKKPLAVILFELPELAASEHQFFVNHNISIFGDARRAVLALARSQQHAEYKAR